jgi:poly(A) polymerase
VCISLTIQTDATKSLDISYPVAQFRNYITESDVYDENTMSVKVVHTRKYGVPYRQALAFADLSSTALPDDVFVKGETRPKKPSKEKKKKAEAKSVKRQFAETGLDVRDSRLTKISCPSPAPRE